MTKPTGAFAVFFKKVSQKKRTMYNGRERRKVHIRNGRNSFETYRYVKQKDPIAVYVTKAATSSSALHCTAHHQHPDNGYRVSSDRTTLFQGCPTSANVNVSNGHAMGTRWRN